MHIRRLALAGAVCGFCLLANAATGDGMPSINPNGVVNAATSQPLLAPGAICSIYGVNLTPGGIGAPSGMTGLPYNIGGMQVLFGGVPAGIFYVSANQVNVMVPNTIIAGPTTVTVMLKGLASNSLPIVLQEVAPGLFSAEHADGSPITSSSPAAPDEIIVLYGTGFGLTQPEPPDRSASTGPAPLVHAADFQVLLDGVPLEGTRVQYAGAAPFFAGLEQVNVQLPGDLSPNNPQLQVSVAGVLSPTGFSLITGAPASN